MREEKPRQDLRLRTKRFALRIIKMCEALPDSRAGRVLFAVLVALGAAFVQFKLFRTNGLLWSLAGFSFAVPFIDWVLPGQKYQWRKPVLVPKLKSQTAPVKENVYDPIPV